MRRGMFALVFVCFLFLTGCQATKGVARGVETLGQETGKGIKAQWVELNKVDAWMRENMW